MNVYILRDKNGVPVWDRPRPMRELPGMPRSPSSLVSVKPPNRLVLAARAIRQHFQPMSGRELVCWAIGGVMAAAATPFLVSAVAP